MWADRDGTGLLPPPTSNNATLLQHSNNATLLQHCNNATLLQATLCNNAMLQYCSLLYSTHRVELHSLHCTAHYFCTYFLPSTSTSTYYYYYYCYFYYSTAAFCWLDQNGVQAFFGRDADESCRLINLISLFAACLITPPAQLGNHFPTFICCCFCKVRSWRGAILRGAGFSLISHPLAQEENSLIG